MPNDPKLNDLTRDGRFREKISAVLNALAANGFDPKIFETKRTLAQQIEKVRKGYSKTLNSYHLRRGSDGGGKAADVASRAMGWNVRKRWWLILGAACQSYGLGWGGLFGLKAREKRALVAAIDELRAAHWPLEHPAYAVRMGWDPAHIQTGSNW